MVPFFESMPLELEDAARVEGCPSLKIFSKIALPLASPGIITDRFYRSYFHGIISFFYGSCGGGQRPFRFAVFNFVSYALIDWGALMAANSDHYAAILAIAFVTQRYIIQGLTAGAVKGELLAMNIIHRSVQ